ncbi:MAG TPA: hypothetical protein VML57_14380 [Burkholderiales bacterium]|jgi:hypothetical protein|nr:hypothetical protein [Burkholderiales bacterium]
MKRLAGKDFLMVLAALALAASVVAGREKPTLELDAPRPAPPKSAAAAPALDLAGLERRLAEGAGADLFAPRSFAPPAAPAKPKPRVAAERPGAPPLPFAYVGKMLEDGKLTVFLARGEESLSVAAGERIGDEYRVESVSEHEITFVYLPLKTRQSLPL